MEKWMEEFEKQLTIAVQDYPQEYGYGVSYIPTVLAKMRLAFQSGTFNKDGRAVRMTCKALGIKHTYKAIQQFLADYK